MRKLILITIAGCVSATQLRAQTQRQPTTDQRNEIVALAGLIQPLLLRGGNFEVDFYTRKMVFEYSHGFSLEMSERYGTIPKQPKEQHLAYHIPFSTGFGVGYRLNSYFDIRFEPKLHKFEVYYEGTDRKLPSSNIVKYSTATLGIGIYFRWKPFKKQDNFLKGITTATSIRYWQNVFSTLDGNEYSYYNTQNQRQENLKASSIGMGGSPVIFNVSVGYSFEMYRKEKSQ